MKYSVAIVLILDVLVVNSKGLLEDNNPNIFFSCSICLAQIENRSVIDGCMHAFCYSCLKEWSKVKVRI